MILTMRRKWLAGVVLTLLGGAALSGCRTPAEVPERTSRECREDPALSGCSYGLPVDVVERRRERAERQATERAELHAEKEAVKAKRWLQQAQNPVTIDDILAVFADGSTNTPVEAPGSAGTGGLAPPVGGRCWDVTSYDFDWGNDVLCQRIDGSQFYTSYAGAEALLSGR